MTREEREEAIEKIRCLQKYSENNEYWWLRNFMEPFNMAIEALEQEPCEDAVSRQAAIDAFGLSEKTRKYGGDNSGYNTMMLYEIQDVIEDLPSVCVAEKTGHWILLDECSNSGYYCSECLKKVVKEGWSNTVKKIKFCPNCGARMIEPQESEG